MNRNVHLRLISRMSEVWGISLPVWYPLEVSKRKDVLALEITDPDKLKEVIRNVLLMYGVKEINKIRDINSVSESFKIDTNQFSIQQNDFNEDTYWCDESLDWIIYACHDGYLTIGGSNFIEHIKSNWCEWNNYLVDVDWL